MNRHENKPLRAEYMARNPRCELKPFRPRGWPACGGNLQAHHILGSWAGTPRADYRTNLMSVCLVCHDFGHTLPNPFRVIGLYQKLRSRELDWEVLNSFSAVCLPGALEKQSFVDACGAWPEVERMRLALLEAA